MTGQEFNCELNRLIEQFSKAAYSQSRADLIWAEVKDLNASWWKRTVDKFIGEERQVPLLPQFRAESDLERNRIWVAKQSQKPEESWVTNAVYCQECNDTGTVLDSQNYAWRCYCERGRTRQSNFPIYQQPHQRKGGTHA